MLRMRLNLIPSNMPRSRTMYKLTNQSSLFAALALGAFVWIAVPSAAHAAPCEPSFQAVARPPAPTGLRIVGAGGIGGSLAIGTVEPNAGTTRLVAATASGNHAYFDRLSQRSNCMVAYSLRNMDQLLAYMDQANPAIKPWDVTYTYPNDPDPRQQDAAKHVIPADQVSLPNNVRLPIPPYGSDSLLVTWESWLGAEFSYANTQIGRYKHFQFASPAGRIWTEVRSVFQDAGPGEVAKLDMRSYGDLGAELGANVTHDNNLRPQLNTFGILPETWTRYWAFFKPVGFPWYEFSLWIADPTKGPVLAFDRLLITPNLPGGGGGAGSSDRWESFWLEYNTSSNQLPPGRGPLVAYARNVVMLRGVSDVAGLLERPAN